MYTLYSTQRSGNCYKVRLALAQLGIPYRTVDVDVLTGEGRTPELLAKHPNGRAPLLEVAPGRYLPEANAILWHVANGSPLVPEDHFDRAETPQWMFFEQRTLEPNLGAAHFWLTLVHGGRELQQHAIEGWMEQSYHALSIMERQLEAHHYFAADHYTVADIALYAYAHLAKQIDLELSLAPAICAWLTRVAAQPNYIDIDWQPGAGR